MPVTYGVIITGLTNTNNMTLMNTNTHTHTHTHTHTVISHMSIVPPHLLPLFVNIWQGSAGIPSVSHVIRVIDVGGRPLNLYVTHAHTPADP